MEHPTIPKVNLDLKVYFKALRFGYGPESDWKIIFILTLALSLIAILLSAFVFWRLDKQEVFVSADAAGGGRSLNLERLKETSLYYEEKEREFESFKSSGPRASVDPGI